MRYLGLDQGLTGARDEISWTRVYQGLTGARDEISRYQGLTGARDEISYSETLNNEHIERIHQMSYSSLSDNGMLQIISFLIK